MLQLFLLIYFQFCHQLAQIGPAVLRIDIQNFFAVIVGAAPVLVLQEHKDTLQVGIDGGVDCAAGSSGVFGLCLTGQNLINAPQQILNGAHLAQILGLQFCKLPGHIVSVDVLIAGDQVLFLVLRHQLQETRPFVFHPHCVEILVISAKNQHDPGGVQGSEDVRLVFLTQLVLQADAGEEHPIALAGQGVIYILRQNRVQGPVAVRSRLFVADKNIIRLFLGRYRNDALADLFNLLCFIPVDSAGHNIRILQRLLKVTVLHNGVEAGAVAGGNLLAGGGIVHIFDAVFAQHQTPVGLCLLTEVRYDGLVNAGGLVKFALFAQALCPLKLNQFLLIVHGGDGLDDIAIFTSGQIGLFQQLQIAAASFTFNNAHGYTSASSWVRISV